MSTNEHHDFRQRFAAGLRRHAVALISLAVALFGTSYNTWRNQTTEAHRNTRAAAFMVTVPEQPGVMMLPVIGHRSHVEPPNAPAQHDDFAERT